MRPARASGFTIIECLAVIAIVGVLVGLLLPAVQSSRENARATYCKNNLINLYLGVETYHAAFAVYPAGTITDRLPARMFPDGKDQSWLVQIRPGFGGGLAFADRWSDVHSVYHPRNWALSQQGPAVLACPSSPFIHASDVMPLSYAGIHDGLDTPIDSSSRGMLIANRMLQASDIPDGLSHTLLLGEIAVEANNTFFWIAGNQSTLRTTALPMQFPTYSGRWWTRGAAESRTHIAYGEFSDPPRITYQMLESEVAANGNQQNLDSMDLVEIALIELNAGLPADPTNGWDGSQITTPQFTLPKLGAEAEQPLPLGSVHEGVVHGAFADGRVVAINQAIDAKLFSQIGIRNDALPWEQPLLQYD